MSNLFAAFNLSVHLLTVSAAFGLVFALLIQPRRNTVDHFLLGFWIPSGLWSIAALLHLYSEGFNLELATLLRLQFTAMMFIAGVFFLFIVRLLKPADQIIRLLVVLLPFAGLIAIGLIWLGQPVSITADENVTLLPTGFGFLAISMGYVGLSFWITLSSSDKNAPPLRLPSLLVVVAYAAGGIDALLKLPVTTLLMTAAAVLLGWNRLRIGMMSSFEELDTELRTANRDLRQVVSDLASERKKTEELTGDLRAANQYKSEFLSNMSHELRTPLNSIIGYSELLRGGIYGSLTEKQSDRIEKIHRNGKRLLELISDVLDLNKIDAGRLKLDIVAFQLKPLLDQVTASVEPDCNEKQITLSIELDDNLPYLFGDEKRVLQILTNLLDNAVKFTHIGGIRLTAVYVNVKNGSSSEFQLPVIGWLRDGDWIIIQVTDTGVGIASEDQGRIFEEFSQVDASHTREFGGTGLGLAITKRLVEMHGGVIWVKSAVGEGSTFFIALPADFRDYTAEKLSADHHHESSQSEIDTPA